MISRLRIFARLLPALIAIALLLPLDSVFAQETTAGVQGTVKDPSGALVANATVEITGASLIGSRKVQTDASGSYRITALPSGTYNLVVGSPGFRTFKADRASTWARSIRSR